jgi:hypothetical protein
MQPRRQRGRDLVRLNDDGERSDHARREAQDNAGLVEFESVFGTVRSGTVAVGNHAGGVLRFSCISFFSLLVSFIEAFGLFVALSLLLRTTQTTLTR